MFYVLVIFTVKSGKGEEFKEALLGCQAKTLKEEGNIEYTVYFDYENPDRIGLFEVYSNIEAFEFHRSMPYLLELRERFNELLEFTPEVIRSSQFAK